MLSQSLHTYTHHSTLTHHSLFTTPTNPPQQVRTNMPAHTNTNPTTPPTMPIPTTPLRPQPNPTTPTRPNYTTPTRPQPNHTTPLRPQPTPTTPTRPPACLPTGTPISPPPYTPSPIFPFPNPPSPPGDLLPRIPYLPPPALNAALDTVTASTYLLHPRLSQFNTTVLLPRLVAIAAVSNHGIDIEQPLPAAIVDLPAFHNVVWRMQREVEEAIEAVAVRALGRVAVVVQGWRGDVAAASPAAGGRKKKQTGEWWLGSAAKYCFGVKE